MGKEPLHIIFYTKENCPLCDEAIDLLTLFKEEYPFTLDKRDIFQKEDWLEKYQRLIPVMEIKDKQLIAEQINYEAVQQLLQTQESK